MEDVPNGDALLHDFDAFDYDSSLVLQSEALSSWAEFDGTSLNESIDWYLTSLN